MLATRKNLKRLEIISEESNKKYETISVEKGRIDAELQVARDIQRSMLPKTSSVLGTAKNIDLVASMTSAKEVGGDWYDFFMVGKNKLAVVIADVSGNGVPAALYMVIAKTLIKSLSTEGLSPKRICCKVNESLCENNKTNMFATAFIGIIDLDTNIMTYANAGHNPPLIKRGKKPIWLTMRSGFMLGGLENSKYTEHRVTLKKQDLLLLYTDGFTEAMNEKKEFYTKERLFRLVSSALPTTSLADIERKISTDIVAFSGSENTGDDRTLLLLKIL